MEEVRPRLQEMHSEILDLLGRLDLPSKETQIAALRKQSADPALWQKPEEAQGILQQLSALEGDVAEWRGLASKSEELIELWAMAEAEGDQTMLDELGAEAEALGHKLSAMRLQVLMSGPHDSRDAILTVYSGAGGTESQDWAQMLVRMYLRWAERRGLSAEVIDEAEGDEAGIKSATVEIKGRNVYGLLRSERGVHRLVRISPFDNAHRRHTSFALVEVIPDVADAISLEINPDDIRTDVYKATGHGGQNVQKNSTAIRLTHIPTGIVVTCQNERSQGQNRERAMAVLKSRIYDLEMQRQEAERAKLRGDHVTVGWGNQIRSYVLHPYRMVKDLRTDWESGNTTAVLDGEIDGLVESYLHHMVGKN
ncbi:MAG: peptide chain release factor 2 [Anaerolineae bacterium]